MATGGKTKYTYSQLRQLWLKNGGNKAWSYVMAAIAMAESSGIIYETHHDANGSVDYGLWQINSVHGYNPNLLVTDANYNAKAAVSIFNSSGPHAWFTYNNGDYKKYLASGKSAPNIADPVPGAGFERIDQGVDYIAKGPVKALSGGTIVSINPFAEGEGVASHTQIVERFDAPITVSGHTYYGGYYAEEKPLVKSGQHVKPGQNVMAGGSDEIGFLVGQGLAMPPLIGGLGAGTQPTREGKDYAGTVHALGGPSVPGESSITQDVIDVGNVLANPIGAAGGAVVSAAKSGADSVGSAITGAFSGMFKGFEAFAYQALFVIIGLGLVIVGLLIVVYTLMEKTGTSVPGVVGMVQQQQRIQQSAARNTESQRASQVREGQAARRISEQRQGRKLSERRLALQEGNAERRQERYVVKDKPNQVVRGKAGTRASGVPT